MGEKTPQPVNTHIRHHCTCWNGRQCLNRHPDGSINCHCDRGDMRNIDTNRQETAIAWGAYQRPRLR